MHETLRNEFEFMRLTQRCIAIIGGVKCGKSSEPASMGAQSKRGFANGGDS